MSGKLYLIPTPIAENSLNTIPEYVLDRMRKIECFIAEDIRTARRYISKIKHPKPIIELTFFVLNKFTKHDEYLSFLKPIKDNYDIGLLTEAGLPCIADPGADIVQIAHLQNIIVVPLTGPSSIFLSLMASGLNGQNFAFIGYLPINKDERRSTLKQLERKSVQDKQTQIFIETPFRNAALLNDILMICKNDTMLCIASEVTTANEFIKTKKIKEWKDKIPDLNKKPSIFLLQSFIK